MSQQDKFQRAVASLHEAFLDDAHWPAASALIEDACGATGHVLVVSEGFEVAVNVLFTGLYYRGQRHEER